jgi:small-conductance mechanosensitive channel
MNPFVDWLTDNLGISSGVQTRLMTSVLAILFVWLLRVLIVKLISRRVTGVRTQYRVHKTSRYIAGTLIILIVGRIWFEGVGSIATFLGLLSAGLAIALKDLILNFVGWLFIVWRRPFEVGDRIEISSFRGDVIDIRLFQFTLMEIGNWVQADQSTGRVIHVPNGLVFSAALANYSKGLEYIWNEIPVLVTFESNWKKAKEQLTEIVNLRHQSAGIKAEAKVREAAGKYMIFFKNLTPIVYTTVKDSGVLLTIRYLCPPRRRRGSEQELWEDILTAFADHPDLDFAYPTTRFYKPDPIAPERTP